MTAKLKRKNALINTAHVRRYAQSVAGEQVDVEESFYVQLEDGVKMLIRQRVRLVHEGRLVLR